MTNNNDVLINVFFAYSREDADLRHRLDKHLSTLKRKNFIQTWYDGKIDAGKEWEKEIDSNLSQADIILLLISADFIASEYCYKVEMNKAISRHKNGDAIVIPILLKSCDWTELPFSDIQALPQNGKPINSPYWKGDTDIPFSEVATSITNIVSELRSSKGKSLKSINSVLKDKENDLKITLELIEEQQLDLAIIDEEISKKRKELRRLIEEYANAEESYNVKSSQLQESTIELENSFTSRKEEYDMILNQKQISINKLKNDENKLILQLEKLKTNTTSLERKISNMERTFVLQKEEYDRMINQKQVSINKIKNNEYKLISQIQKLRIDVLSLEKKMKIT